MKNKFKLGIATTLAAVTSVFVCVNINAGAENVETIAFSNEIVAVTPYSGESVSVVHNGMETVLNMANPTQAELAKYYHVRPEMKEFFATGAIPSTQEEIRAVYDLCDDFAPVGNELKWAYSEGADSYTVNLSLDKHFTKVVFSKTVEECSVDLGNTLYSGTDYYWQVIANDGETQTRSNIFEFTTKAGTRTVDIDGVSNTRDVGGYQTPNGVTKQGLIYRTARFDDVTDEGKATAQQLGIKTDLDLRSIGEGRENPLGLDNYVQATPAPVYTNGINTVEGKAAIKTIFATFADKDNYPIAMHCSVGRDRTGTAVALLNALLGVEEQTIINEYLLSVFGYISSWDKASDALFTNIQGLFAYIHTFEGETLADKTEALLLDAGVTAEEMQSVRDIMLGETVVFDNTVDCEINYEGMHFVTFKAYGFAKQTFAIKSGLAIKAPYALGEDWVWTVDGKKAEEEQIVEEDTLVQAEKEEFVKITVSVLGEEHIIKATAGDEIDFSSFAKEGYSYKVMNTRGDIITSLKAEKDCAVSILYFKN